MTIMWLFKCPIIIKSCGWPSVQVLWGRVGGLWSVLMKCVGIFWFLMSWKRYASLCVWLHSTSDNITSLRVVTCVLLHNTTSSCIDITVSCLYIYYIVADNGGLRQLWWVQWGWEKAAAVQDIQTSCPGRTSQSGLTSLQTNRLYWTVGIIPSPVWGWYPALPWHGQTSLQAACNVSVISDNCCILPHYIIKLSDTITTYDTMWMLLLSCC